MAKKQPAKRARAPKSQLRVQRLPVGALSLAKYHAALSDPFVSEPVGIPDGAPAVTVKGKCFDMIAVSNSSSVDQLDVELTMMKTQTETSIVFKHGQNGATKVTLPNSVTWKGEGRIVSAGIRVIYGGRRDALGGITTTQNSAGDDSTFKPGHFKKFTGTAVALWEPYRLTDFEFHSGYGDNREEPQDRTRSVLLNISSAGDLRGSLIEFVVLYETEAHPTSPALNHVSLPMHTYVPTTNRSAGSHHVANIAKRMTNTPRAANSGISTHTRMTHYKDMLVDGIKHATEIMGVTASAGTAYKQLSAAMSLGADLESDAALASQVLGSTLMLTM